MKIRIALALAMLGALTLVGCGKQESSADIKTQIEAKQAELAKAPEADKPNIEKQIAELTKKLEAAVKAEAEKAKDAAKDAADDAGKKLNDTLGSLGK